MSTPRLARMLMAYLLLAVLPCSAALAAVPIPGLNFNGVGNGFQSYVPNHSTSDSTGAAGETQYVQAVNTSYAVFDKATGALLEGPLPLSDLFAGFGGACDVNSELQTDIIKHADPIVLYDRLADRWFITYFAWDESSPDMSGIDYHYWQCIAVSQTSDATGAYNRYAFESPLMHDGQGSNFHYVKNDYGKFGVWPDAYYASYYLEAPAETYIGSQGGMACAYEREAMLAGLPARQICFTYQSPGMSWLYNYPLMIPADMDGDTPPPAGSPNYFMAQTVGSLRLFEFQVDWANPSNSTFTGPVTLPVNAFTTPCSNTGSRNCIPQLGTTAKIDALGPRLMNRLAYRNFGTHESLVVNHSVETTFGTGRNLVRSAGVRWYEIRNPGGTPVVHQQSTFAPNSTARWMGSVAMDKMGNLAVGYSMSSATINPRIAYANRLAGDALNTLSNETILHSGTGSKTSNRWGDYTHMSIDPVDDCTFWYTNQYMQTTGTRWSTRIGSFRLPGCQ